MSVTVSIEYRQNEDRYRAEFERDGKVENFKYLTPHEWEALEEFYPIHVGMTEPLVRYAGSMYDCIAEQHVPMDLDSNFFLMLEDLLKIKH